MCIGREHADVVVTEENSLARISNVAALCVV